MNAISNSFKENSNILFLIPSVLLDGTQKQVLPAQLYDAVKVCRYFLVEEIRTARRFISSLSLGLDITQLKFYVVDKDSTVDKVKGYLKEIPKNENIGMLSEAGCPGIADPGALAAAAAHESGRKVVPLVGPSSILLALMGSGFNGQSFCFNGYLPIQQTDRTKKITQLETEVYKKNQTQIFIETPFRNNHLYQDILATCKPETKLCVASNLTGQQESIITLKIKDWKKKTIDLHKQLVIFLLYF